MQSLLDATREARSLGVETRYAHARDELYQRRSHQLHGVHAEHTRTRDTQPMAVSSSFEPHEDDPLMHHATANQLPVDTRQHTMPDVLENRERLSELSAHMYADAIVNKGEMPIELVFVRASPSISDILQVE